MMLLLIEGVEFGIIEYNSKFNFRMSPFLFIITFVLQLFGISAVNQKEYKQ